MPATTELKRMEFYKFVNNIPRIPILFIRKDKKVFFTEKVILDTGANVFAITKDVFEFLSKADYNIKEIKRKAETGGGEVKFYEIDDVSFVIGFKDDNVMYEHEKVYYSPTAVNVSAGVNPIFADFTVLVDFPNKIILEPRIK